MGSSREVGLLLDDAPGTAPSAGDRAARAARPSARCRCAPSSASATPSASAISARLGQQVRDERADRCRARARRARARARCATSRAASPAAGSSSSRDLDQPPPAASRASHGRSDCASALGTERARAHELDDLAAVGADRLAGAPRTRSARAPGRARAPCRCRAARSRARRRPAPRRRARARAAPPTTATCSLRRRAASGAIVMRSSMPSASSVEAVSVETGWASERASTMSAWLAQASSESAHSLLSASASCSPVPRPVSGACSSLTERSCALEIAGHERDAREVERRGERQRLVVRNRDDELVADDDERVLVRGVELDRELRAGEGEGVVDRARGCRRRCGT